MSDSLQPHGIQHSRLASLSFTLSRSLLKRMSIESYADDTTLMAESREELMRLLMKVKEESEKSGLKLNIQKDKFMASGLITSWQINGEKMETVTNFYFLGLQNQCSNADSDGRLEITRLLLLGRKAMTNVESILKSRNITLPTKVHIVKAMVFQ